VSDSVIELNHVWKEYPLSKNSPGLKEYAVQLHRFIRKNRQENRHFYALKDLSLKIEKEECVGIIGKNGAGKSTLLSLMLGTIFPSKGTVTVAERVTPLLELGAGFHPDLTGWENILLNGVLLGLTKSEVMDKMSSIIIFSELDEFINAPLRTYSSGMSLRLAFSIAIHADPKILIIDEVLSVGDEGFQIKSKEAMMNLIKGGVTTVFVSHGLKAMEEMCNRVVWINRGEIVADGKPVEVIEKYRQEIAREH